MLTVSPSAIDVYSNLVAVLGLSNKFMRIGAYCSADLYELGHIQPSFAEFELRDKRLARTDSPSNLFLCELGRLARIYERVNQPTVYQRVK